MEEGRGSELVAADGGRIKLRRLVSSSHTGNPGEIHQQRARPPKARPHVRAPTLGTVITAST